METKIIKAVFGASKSIITQPRYRYDYGQVIEVSGIDLPESFEARLSNAPTGESVRVLGSNQRIAVPDDLFYTGKSIWCYITIHDETTDGRTMYTIRIPIKDATERTDAEPTPVQQDIISQAIATLNSAVEQTAQDVESADASAQSARADADRAETARDTTEEYVSTVQGYAHQAQTAAQNASASATASAQSASTAQQIKTDVDGMVDDAQSAASASALSATESAQSASRAYMSASVAAQDASASAESALQAQASAQTASTKASEASQSASQALSYKTDAESAKTASQTAQGLAESARDTAVQAKTDAEQAKADAESARDEAQQAVASISGALDDKADIITDTASGSIASFSDGADDLPLKSLVVDINPIQDLSNGDPSPENICPISGWTSVGVNHSGADMTNPTTITINLGQTVYGGKLDVLSGVLTVDRAIVGMGTLNYFYVSSGNINAFRSNIGAMPVTDNIQHGITSIYPFAGTRFTSNMPNLSWMIDSQGRFFVRDDSYSDVTAFKTAVTGQTLVYELATPITLTLTPHEIKSLLGDNNLWADTGDSTVTYRADTTLYINRKIAEAVSALS